LSTNRLREEAHREVMRLYAAAGQPDAALRRYAELERLLKQELDSAPGAESRALARAIEQGSGGATEQRGNGATGQGGGGLVLPCPVAPLPRCSVAPLRPALEPVGGAVPLGSIFYVERPPD